MYRDCLVLGSGIAGLKAAEAIRDLDANGSVMMVTRDSVSPIFAANAYENPSADILQG